MNKIEKHREFEKRFFAYQRLHIENVRHTVRYCPHCQSIKEHKKQTAKHFSKYCRWCLAAPCPKCNQKDMMTGLWDSGKFYCKRCKFVIGSNEPMEKLLLDKLHTKIDEYERMN